MAFQLKRGELNRGLKLCHTNYYHSSSDSTEKGSIGTFIRLCFKLLGQLILETGYHESRYLIKGKPFEGRASEQLLSASLLSLSGP